MHELWFVSKYGRDTFAKITADFFIITFVSNLNKPIDGGFVQGIHISSTFIAPARTAVLLWCGITSGDTKDDFLTAYGLGLNDENRAKVYQLTTDHMANTSGACCITLRSDSGTLTSRAWYNLGTQLNLDANSNPESIRYNYSNDGDYDMDYTGTSNTCDPFVVSIGANNQVVEAYFTVKYSANGGTGTLMENTIISKGVSTPLRLNTYTKPGYHFAGWSAYRAYDGKYLGYAQGSQTLTWLPLNQIANYYIYSDGQSIANTTYSGTVTMSAIWTSNQ